MNRTNVISINPARKTIGAICEDGFKAEGLSRRLLATALQTPDVKEAASAVMGVNGNETGFASFKFICIRFICAAVTAMFALAPLMSGTFFVSDINTILELSFCVLLLLGLFTRISAVGMMGYMGYLVVMSAMSGIIETQYIIETALSAVIAILGPGRYSIDNSFRLAYQYIKRRRQQRRSEQANSYKAYLTEF